MDWMIVVCMVSATVFWIFPTLEPYMMDRSREVGTQDGENKAQLEAELGLSEDAPGTPESPAPPAYVPPFDVLPSGGIRLTSAVSPKFSILGSAIQYGAGGPEVPVSLDVIINGSPTQLFKGKGSQVTPQSGATLNNLPAQTLLHFRGKSYHPTSGSTLYTQQTVTASKMVIPLRNGDYVPDKTPFAQQPSIKSFLQSVINPSTKKVTIAENQVLYLMELGTNNTSSPAADFQDLVFLATF